MSQKAQRRPGPGEISLAVTKHDGVQVDSVLIDQAKCGQAVRQVRTGNFDLPVALGLQLADRALQIVLNKPGVGADRLQRARDDPFRLGSYILCAITRSHTRQNSRISAGVPSDTRMC